MQIVTEKREGLTGGMLASRQCDIKIGPHMMILLSGLYQDPKDAMAREYITNMYDGVVALRNSDPSATLLPSIVRIPTRLNPTVEFQDFGIGMTHDETWRYFFNYGDTTKGQSNDQVGGLGVGCKVGFCYNNGAPFTITTVKNGVKNVYMAFIGDDGIPTGNHVSTEETADHSGVTVSIPVLTSDIYDIDQAVRKYASYYPLELTLENTTTPIEKPDYDFTDGELWGMKGVPKFGYAHITVIMGNIPYPVDKAFFNSDCPIIRTDLIDDNCWDIYLPIGSAEIVPSREGLKYTDRTKKVIADALEAAQTDFITKAVKGAEGAESEWEAIKMVYALYQKISGFGSCAVEMTWQGKKLIPNKGVERSLTDATAALNLTDVSKHFITSGNDSVPTKVENPERLIVSPKENSGVFMSMIVIDDLTRGIGKVVNELIKSSFVAKKSNGRAMKSGHKANGTVYVFKTNKTKEEVGDYFGGMTVDHIFFASELKKPVVRGIRSSTPKGPKYLRCNVYRWTGTDNRFEARTEVPENETAYHYVVLEKNNGTGRYTHPNMADLATVILNTSADVDTNKIYGILPDDVQKLPSTWINMLDTITAAVVQGMLDNPKACQQTHGYSVDKKALEFLVTIPKALTDTEPSIAMVVEDAKAAKNSIFDSATYAYRTWVYTGNLLGADNKKKIALVATDIKDKAANDKLEDKIATMLQTYPVLNMAFQLWNGQSSYYTDGGTYGRVLGNFVTLALDTAIKTN